jgi:type IV pilus assembly protein PilW
MNLYQCQKLAHNIPVKQRGMSLIELMVAMSLGIFLTWGALQAFLTGKQTYSMQQAFSRIQENGRMAQEFIGFDVRNAGSYGCAAGQFIVQATASNKLTNPTNTENNFANSVFGSNNGTTGLAFTTALNPLPLANTDVLVVHTGTNLGLAVLAAPLPTVSAVKVAVPTIGVGLASGDVIAVGNCTTFTVTKASTVAAGTVTFSSALPAAPAIGSFVMKLETAIYYVANNAAGTPSLYRRMLADGATSQELLSGVENLQVEYGIQDAAYRTTQFLTADAVTALGANAWSSWVTTPVNTAPRVSAIRYSLLMRSTDNVLDIPQTYTYNGATVTAADRRLRQVFTGTVGIRGQVL